MSGLGRTHLTQYPLRYYAKLNMAGPKVSFNLSHVCLLYLRGRRGVASVPRSSDSKQTCMFLTVFSVHDGRGKNPSSFEIFGPAVWHFGVVSPMEGLGGFD